MGVQKVKVGVMLCLTIHYTSYPFMQIQTDCSAVRLTAVRAKQRLFCSGCKTKEEKEIECNCSTIISIITRRSVSFSGPANCAGDKVNWYGPSGRSKTNAQGKAWFVCCMQYNIELPWITMVASAQCSRVWIYRQSLFCDKRLLKLSAVFKTANYST